MTSLSAIIEEIREIFVTKEIFDLRVSPLEKMMYGFVTLILVSIVGIAGTAITFFLRMKP